MPTIKELQADLCLICTKPMRMARQEFVKNDDGSPGILMAYVCDTTDCEWEGTGRAIHTDMRGNVFQRNMGERGMDKDWPKLTPDALFRGKAALEEVLGQRIEDDKNIPSLSQLEKERQAANKIVEIEK
jgi:hypothetical protein